MKYSIKINNSKNNLRRNILESNSDCIIIGIFADEDINSVAAIVDSNNNGIIKKLISSGDFDATIGKTLILYALTGIKAKRVLLIGLGKRNKFNEQHYINIAEIAFKKVNKIAQNLLFTLLENCLIFNKDISWAISSTILAHNYASYEFNEMKTTITRNAKEIKIEHITIMTSNSCDIKFLEKAVIYGQALVKGINFAKNLSNLPSNVCTPIYLSKIAEQLANTFKLKIEIFTQQKIAELRMHAFLTVAKGSVQPPYFIVLRYYGISSDISPIVLIGKGITFDAGGISIKPSDAMDEMKFDMCGAAAVLGTLLIIASLQIPLNVIVVIPACENMPSGNAMKPGDIIQTMSGKTVEILNTDAEGRLILCDALTYVEYFKPSIVIDVATLTGACVVALGNYNSGLFSNSDLLADELFLAGQHMLDSCWRLPIAEAYQDQLNSKFADMVNVSEKSASCITAACFLSRFATNYKWAHLDIAGTATYINNDHMKSATGRPILLLTGFLIKKAYGTYNYS